MIVELDDAYLSASRKERAEESKARAEKAAADSKNKRGRRK